jgi:hypothetical protein
MTKKFISVLILIYLISLINVNESNNAVAFIQIQKTKRDLIRISKKSVSSIMNNLKRGFREHYGNRKKSYYNSQNPNTNVWIRFG